MVSSEMTNWWNIASTYIDVDTLVVHHRKFIIPLNCDEKNDFHIAICFTYNFYLDYTC